LKDSFLSKKKHGIQKEMSSGPRTFLEDLDDWVSINLNYVVILVVLSGISLCKLMRRKVALAPLPYGWEERTQDGMTFFIDRIKKETTWKDPRQAVASPPAKRPIKMIQPISLEIMRILTFYIMMEHISQGLLHTDGARVLDELAL